MGAGVALTVSDTHEQISTHKVHQHGSTAKKHRPVVADNRPKMETIYEVNEP
jgi:hypothetical protein